MTYQDHVRNGVVLLDGVELPEGAEVRVEVVKAGAEPGDKGPTLYEQLSAVIGIAKGLPADMAENHDHYLHGRPKR